MIALAADEEEEHVNPRLKILLNFASYAAVAVLLYLALLLLCNVDYFVPYDGGFALVLLWAGAQVGGHLAKWAGIPQLLGMLVAGMMLKNIGDPVRGLPSSWAAAIRAFGLMNILMRGGLEMDLTAVRRLGLAVIRLTVMPGVSEAFTAAGLGCIMFDMPFFLALATGFILAAVSPAVVVGGMFDLQHRGYGVAKGIPSLVVAAASFDDVVAISGFSMCIGVAIDNGGSLLAQALHGPLEIVSGVSFGLLGALIMTATKLWNQKWKRTAGVLLLAVTFTFGAKKAHLSGAGALASLVLAAASSQFWLLGVGTKAGVAVGVLEDASHEVEEDLCLLWRLVSEPLLFGVIGAALDFSAIDSSVIPKSLGVIAGGVLIRCVAATFATFGAGLSWKERIFIALAWLPKATVQAALCSVPLDLATDTLKREDDPAKYDRYQQYGNEILATAVFSILLTAPIGLVVIQQLGPRWLEKDAGADAGGNNDEERGGSAAEKRLHTPPPLPPSGFKDTATTHFSSTGCTEITIVDAEAHGSEWGAKQRKAPSLL